MVLAHIYRFTHELYAEAAHSTDFRCNIPTSMNRVSKVSDALFNEFRVIGSRYCQSSMVLARESMRNHEASKDNGARLRLRPWMALVIACR